MKIQGLMFGTSFRTPVKMKNPGQLTLYRLISYVGKDPVKTISRAPLRCLYPSHTGAFFSKRTGMPQIRRKRMNAFRRKVLLESTLMPITSETRHAPNPIQ
ncbi:MAG: hypothetical protein KAR39_11125 [Thermoplasmata archaeon]|nr:hypothetical protein [Thermoplasmata archaeon]